MAGGRLEIPSSSPSRNRRAFSFVAGEDNNTSSSSLSVSGRMMANTKVGGGVGGVGGVGRRRCSCRHGVVGVLAIISTLLLPFGCEYRRQKQPQQEFLLPLLPPTFVCGAAAQDVFVSPPSDLISSTLRVKAIVDDFRKGEEEKAKKQNIVDGRMRGFVVQAEEKKENASSSLAKDDDEDESKKKKENNTVAGSGVVVGEISESERRMQGKLASPAEGVIPSRSGIVKMRKKTSSSLSSENSTSSNSSSEAEAEAAKKMPPRCTTEHLLHTQGVLVDLDGTIYNSRGLYPSSGPKKGEISREFHNVMTDLKMPMTYLSNGFKDTVCTARKLSQPGYDINRNGGKMMGEKYVETHFWSAARAVALFLEEKFSFQELKVYMLATSSSCGPTLDNCTATILRNVDEEKRRKWEIRMDLSLDEVEKWARMGNRRETNVVVVLSIERIPKDTVGGNKALLYDRNNNPIEENFLMIDPVHGIERAAYDTLTYDVLQKAGRLLRNNALLIAGAPDPIEAHPRLDGDDVDQNLPSIGSLLAYLRTVGELYPGSDKEKKLFRSTGKGGKDGAYFMMRQGVKLLEKQSPKTKFSNGRIVMIGDNLLTDILAAWNVGDDEEPYMSVLVNTGAHLPSDCAALGVFPTCWVEDVEELANLYKAIKESGRAEWPESEIVS